MSQQNTSLHFSLSPGKHLRSPRSDTYFEQRFRTKNLIKEQEFKWPKLVYQLTNKFMWPYLNTHI